MPSINNFTQAMRELTGFGDEDTQNNQWTPDHDKEELTAEIETTPKKQPLRFNVSTPVFDEETGSRITSTMVVKGQIEGTSPIKIEGQVAGDIRVTSSTIIDGVVVGNIMAQNINVAGAVKGNLTSVSDLSIGPAAVVVGHTKSENIYISGKLKGNIDNHLMANVDATAVILGDIITDKLISGGGCFIGGSITTRENKNFDFDEEKLFNIGG